MAGCPPPLSTFHPLSYVVAAARRPGLSALARGLQPQLPDPTAALAAFADLALPTLNPAAADAILPSAWRGVGAGGVDVAGMPAAWTPLRLQARALAAWLRLRAWVPRARATWPRLGPECPGRRA
jgi:hypothetical protein